MKYMPPLYRTEHANAETTQRQRTGPYTNMDRPTTDAIAIVNPNVQRYYHPSKKV